MHARRSILLGLTAAALVASSLGAGTSALGATAAPKRPTLVSGHAKAAPVLQLRAGKSTRRSSVKAPALRRPGTTSNIAPAGTANFVVNYTGFAPYPQAQAAFQAAVDTLSTLFTSNQTIEVNAAFTSQGANILGSASAGNYWGLSGPAKAGTVFYPSALANLIYGQDVDNAQGQPKAEIVANFNSDFTNWYFGTDGNTPFSNYDFESVVMHELMHGLGFAGSMNVASGSGSWGQGTGVPFAFDVFGGNVAGQSLIDTTAFANPSTALGSQLTGGQLTLRGQYAVRGAAGGTPRLYAPATWQGGSSFSHLDEATYPAGNANSLMTYALANGESVHTPGPIALGAMRDMGWVDLNVPAAPTAVSATPGKGSATVNWTAPSDVGGTAITSYVVTPSTGSPVTTAAGATSTVFNGLTPGTPISFTVAAVNAIGKSPAASTGSISPQSLVARLADFDGNGTSDIAVFRPSTGQWYIQGQASPLWGTSGDLAAPADYNGDGKADVAVFRPSTGQWYIQGQPSPNWGTSGDVPVSGDYDGDGKAEVGVYRPSSGQWYILGQPRTIWGTTGDIPVPGDYNGDGKTDVAVFRPSDGRWYILGQPTPNWGTTNDIPVPADYNGDGKTDVAVFRPSTGQWFILGQTSPVWGTTGDVPLSAPTAYQVPTGSPAA